MKPSALALAAVLAGLLWLLIFAAIDSYARVALAPPWVCTMQNRLEIYVDEDLIMYACECEALSSGHICRWQVIGGVDDPSTYPRLRRIAARAHVVPRLIHPSRRELALVRRYRIPAVVR